MGKTLITGANGFIGKHLLYAIKERVVLFDKEYDYDYLKTVLKQVDFIYHLAAGIKDGFEENLKLTQFIVDNAKCPILFASSIQTESEYGKNKRLQEDIIRSYKGTKYVYRLSNVFGKWCRPHYNNVVASFIYDVQNNKELIINDPEKEVGLVYINDVIQEFLNPPYLQEDFYTVKPIYKIKVGELATIIRNLKDNSDLLTKLIETYNA